MIFLTTNLPEPTNPGQQNRWSVCSGLRWSMEPALAAGFGRNKTQELGQSFTVHSCIKDLARKTGSR